MTLRTNQREHYLGRLTEIFGEDMAGRYRRQFGNYYECRCPNVKALWATFADKCEKYGILYKMQDIISAYKQGYESSQLTFF